MQGSQKVCPQRRTRGLCFWFLLLLLLLLPLVPAGVSRFSSGADGPASSSSCFAASLAAAEVEGPLEVLLPAAAAAALLLVGAAASPGRDGGATSAPSKSSRQMGQELAAYLRALMAA
jgi:hypothetical protein